MAFFTRYRAVFVDRRGMNIGRDVKMPRLEKSFKFKDGEYIVDLNASSWYRFNPIFESYYFFYNLDSTQPINLYYDKTKEIDPKVLADLMDNKYIRQIANPSSFKLSDLFTLKNLVILVIIIAIVFYLTQSGGKLV